MLLSASADADSSQPSDAGNNAPVPAEPSFTNGLFAPARTTLLGDAGGMRTFLAKYGITFSLNEQSEVLGNATGGTRQGVAYDGVTTPAVQLDTNKAFGWAGGLFNVSAFQIHGSAKGLAVLQAVSGLEAMDSTRLWEL
jgi:porin